MMRPRNVSPVQWDQAIGLARQTCARIFRDGGSPEGALEAFGLVASGPAQDWDRAIARIAQRLCASAR